MINKLVRDLVKPLKLEKIIHLRRTPALHKTALISKMHEEVEEIARQPWDNSEYADVLACLMDLAEISAVDWEDVLAVERAKRELKGGFLRGIFITDKKGR